jgi:hypothetical protein
VLQNGVELEIGLKNDDELEQGDEFYIGRTLIPIGI